MTLAAHLVGVPPVIPDHLRTFIRNVLGDSGEKIRRREDLEVPVNFRVQTGAVNDGVLRCQKRHFFDREGIAKDVLGELFQESLVFWGDRFAMVDIETSVFPGME